MIFKTLKYKIVGDTGLLVQFGEEIDRETNFRVHNLVHAIESTNPKGLIEVVPAYNTLLINYNPMMTSIDFWLELVESLCSNPESYSLPPSRLTEIPVFYGEDCGPDIEFVAKINELTIQEVMRIHSSVDYFIYMLGFTPGFAYLGGMSDRLFAPRLDTPRDRVLPGSIGIANTQTGIYPITSAGGWRLIGRTPLELFRPESAHPFRYQPGDYIRFCPIDRSEYNFLSSHNA